MKLTISKDYETLSQEAAGEIIAAVATRPSCILCLATGDTPKRTYALVAEIAAKRSVDFSQCFFVGLDEWAGISGDNEGSCRYFLNQRVFGQLNIVPSQVRLFDGMASDLEEECKKMDRVIEHHGGIDLMLVGVGMNGHIGFNEPADALEPHSHIVELDTVTTTVGQKYFPQRTGLKRGITLGINEIMQTRKLLLLANGLKKAEVIQKALEGEPSPRLPASMIRKHPNLQVMLDKEASSKLSGGLQS